MQNDTTFFSSRGCYYLIRGIGSPSFYAVSPSMGAPCPILYNNVSITGRDHVAKTLCFNNIRHAAVTSKDFGTASVGGIALLGSVEETASFAAAFMGFVQQARVYQKVGTCMVSSAAGGAHRFLLEEYTLGQINPEYNIQEFTFGGSLLD